MKHKSRSVADLEKLIKQKELELAELQMELQQAEDHRREQTKQFLKKNRRDDDMDW